METDETRDMPHLTVCLRLWGGDRGPRGHRGYYSEGVWPRASKQGYLSTIKTKKRGKRKFRNVKKTSKNVKETSNYFSRTPEETDWTALDLICMRKWISKGVGLDLHFPYIKPKPLHKHWTRDETNSFFALEASCIVFAQN